MSVLALRQQARGHGWEDIKADGTTASEPVSCLSGHPALSPARAALEALPGSRNVDNWAVPGSGCAARSRGSFDKVWRDGHAVVFLVSLVLGQAGPWG